MADGSSPLASKLAAMLRAMTGRGMVQTPEAGRLERVDLPPLGARLAATNNTSLTLAIEIGDEPGTGPVLRLPGDTQIGCWLSRQNVIWPAAVTPGHRAAPRRRHMGCAAAGGTLFDGFTLERVRRLFRNTPIAPIRLNLDTALDGLRVRCLADREMLLMALATIRAETEGLVPIDEGRNQFNTRNTPFELYESGTSTGNRIGNTQRGDGPRSKGRGFVQFTGRDNSRASVRRSALTWSTGPSLPMIRPWRG